MSARRALWGVLTTLILGTVLIGCGGPTSPSGVTVLRGTVDDEAASASAMSGASAAASAARVTVTVLGTDPLLTTTVNNRGEFTLQGLPEGDVTLEFSRNGRILGTLTLEEVLAGQEIEIRVKVTGHGVTLLEETRSDGEDDGDDGEDDGGNCMIHGGREGERIELEGRVESGDAEQFMLRVNGNRASDLVTVKADGAQFDCHGQGSKDLTPTECKARVEEGAKVHVKGQLEECSADEATVEADRIMVQK